MQNDILSELPEGFAMALAANIKALEAFSAMDDGAKARVIEGCRGLASKEDMRTYVAKLT